MGCRPFQMQSVEHLCSILHDFNWQRARTVPLHQQSFLLTWVKGITSPCYPGCQFDLELHARFASWYKTSTQPTSAGVTRRGLWSSSEIPSSTPQCACIPSSESGPSPSPDLLYGTPFLYIYELFLTQTVSKISLRHAHLSRLLTSCIGLSIFSSAGWLSFSYKLIKSSHSFSLSACASVCPIVNPLKGKDFNLHF